MSGIPPNDDGPDEIDQQYRRASVRDPSRPSESAGRIILAHAAQLAAVRKPTARAPSRGWKPMLLGSLAAAVFAGLLMTPVFFRPTVPPPNLPTDQASQSAAETSIAPKVSATAEAPKPSPAPDNSAPRNLPQEAPARGATPARGVAANESARGVVRQESAAPAEAPSFTAGAIADRPETARASDSSAKTAQAVAPAEAIDQGAALRRAAELGDIAALQLLLYQHVDLEGRDALGRTALMLATLKGQFDSVQALLAHGADPSAADAKGVTPLHAALAGNHPAIVAALERAGGQ
jgi:hypothetical protein